jgi:hypothetical protein
MVLRSRQIPVTAGNNRFHRYAILPLSDETLKALGYEWCWDLRLLSAIRAPKGSDPI